MRDMIEALTAKIAERRARLMELAREQIVAEAELRAYEDACEMISGRQPSCTETRPLASEGATARKAIIGAARRVRKSSAVWESIVAECAPSLNAVFNIDDVLTSAARRNFTPTRGNVRSQMAAYIGRGLLERVAQGSFRITVDGLPVFGTRHQQAPLEGTPATDRASTDQTIPGRPPDLTEGEMNG